MSDLILNPKDAFFQAPSESDKNTFAAELSDPQRVRLICETHNFDPADITQFPTAGCEGCARVWFFYQFATCPPHRRAEMIERTKRAVYDACALEDRDKLDIQIHRPIIEAS